MNLPAKEVKLSDRITLRTLDSQVIVRPVVDEVTVFRTGDLVACFTPYGVERWNTGEDLSAICFWPFACHPVIARAQF